MKLREISFVLFILFASFLIGFGQEKPRAEVVDDMGRENCESFWARFDGFYSILQNEPASTGYMIIYGEKNSLQKNLGYEKLADGIIKFRNLDPRRFVIVHAKEENSLRIQFWKVPDGADSPNYISGNWDLTIKQKKPFILQRYSEGDGICPSNVILKLFADYLTANPKMNANTVIAAKTAENFAVAKKDAIGQLENDYHISPNRLKFFFVKNKKHSDNFNHFEYWLIPNKF